MMNIGCTISDNPFQGFLINKVILLGWQDICHTVIFGTAKSVWNTMAILCRPMIVQCNCCRITVGCEVVTIWLHYCTVELPNKESSLGGTLALYWWGCKKPCKKYNFQGTNCTVIKFKESGLLYHLLWSQHPTTQCLLNHAEMLLTTDWSNSTPSQCAIAYCVQGFGECFSIALHVLLCAIFPGLSADLLSDYLFIDWSFIWEFILVWLEYWDWGEPLLCVMYPADCMRNLISDL